MTDDYQVVSRGEVWLMQWDDGGREDMAEVFRYPVLIISTDLQANNPHFPDVVVVPCDLVDESLPIQLYVTITPTEENRLPHLIQAEIHVFHTIPKSLLQQRIGRLSKAEMDLIGSKIRMVLELD